MYYYLLLFLYKIVDFSNVYYYMFKVDDGIANSIISLDSSYLFSS